MLTANKPLDGLSNPETLLDVLHWRALHQGNHIACTFLTDGEQEAIDITYHELDRQARKVAAELERLNARTAKILILCPPGLDYIISLFGCMYAGAVPIPTYPPRINRSDLRLQGILQDAGAGICITTRAILNNLKKIIVHNPEFKQLTWLALEDLIAHHDDDWQKPLPGKDALAFLQYTSGSTSSPKGVMIGHDNLFHNLQAIKENFEHTEQTRGVIWLPPYHDMGLIGGIFQPIYSGFHVVLMAPVHFIQQPFRWLKAITRYKATTSGAPNFAYQLCIDKIEPGQRKELDLSYWDVAFNGAERISGNTLKNFKTYFGACGFSISGFHNCFGLAESTLIVTGGKKKEEYATRACIPSAIARGQVEHAVAGADEIIFVSSGRAVKDTIIRIVDPTTATPCKPNEIGEIWVAGPGVAKGYWNKPELSGLVFQATLPTDPRQSFLRTGDIGFLDGEELFVIGRLKDMMTINGANYYPEDIETAIPGIYHHIKNERTVAFSVLAEEVEELVVLVEVKPGLSEQDAAAFGDFIRQEISMSCGLRVWAVALVETKSLPVTSSGKIQRHLCKQQFLERSLKLIWAHYLQQPFADGHAVHDYLIARADLTPDAIIDKPVDNNTETGGGPGFSLFFFSSNEQTFSENKYQLVLAGSQYADKNNFTAVWTPERHFHGFGGLYPNPSVLSAALAMVTTKIRLRAGSVVLPLHHPVRVAEEWAVVDNLSRGRVDLAFARGWNPDDFLLAPDQFQKNDQVLFSKLEIVQKLWKGESIEFVNGKGEKINTKIFPLPQQKELPVWITCTGGEERFRQAGAVGANVLTALLFQNTDELAQKISIYQQALEANGHRAGNHQVTLMLHTFIGKDQASVREIVRAPFIEYLESSVDLWKKGATSLDELTPEEKEKLLDYAFERYYHTSALFGPPETCLPIIEKLLDAGVTEIACLIDFGIDPAIVLDHLPYLNELRLLVNQARAKKQHREEPAGTPVHPTSNNGTAIREQLQATLITCIAGTLHWPEERILPAANLHSFGINSIRIIEIMEKVRRRININLPANLVFEYPTITDLCTYLLATHEKEIVAGLSAVNEPEKKQRLIQQPTITPPTTFPLSFGQHALWLMHQLAPESPAYNLLWRDQITSRVDTVTLQLSFQQLLERHPGLRTTYHVSNGRLYQQVHSEQEVIFEVTNASGLGLPELEETIRRTGRQPFDLATGPLVRVHLFSQSDHAHTLLIVAHHIVCDLWSMLLLVEELRLLYTNRVLHPSMTLPQPAIHLAEYINWQEEVMRGPEGERQWNYWKKQLGGELPILNLPYDFMRPPVVTYNGATYRFDITKELVQPCKELAKAESVTLYMVLLAAFEVLLYRYTNQQDILIGSPVSCRNHIDLWNMVGHIMNPVGIREDLSGNPAFRALLGRVYQTVTMAFHHQEYPYNLLVQQLEIKRDISRPALFQVMFAFHQPDEMEKIIRSAFSAQNGHQDALPLQHQFIEQQEGQFELHLEICENGHDFSCFLKYNTDLFSQPTIERMAKHFTTLLESITRDPGQRIADLPLLDEKEQQQLILDWNNTERSFPDDETFLSQFEKQVAKTPGAIAVTCEGMQLNYWQLNARANRLAHHLLSAGLQPEQLVAVMDKRGINLLTALLAIFKAGGAYLPLDPHYPPDRTAQILTQSKTRLILCGDQCRKIIDQAPGTSDTVPGILSLDQLINTERPDQPLPARPLPQHLAYVIYTSGSTGLPKGVMIEHSGMYNHLMAKVIDLKITEKDIMAQTATQCFDISIWQFLAVLITGGRVVILDDELVGVPRLLIGQVAHHKITILEIVPSLVRSILDEVSLSGQRGLQSLRWMISTGETLPTALTTGWFRHFPGIPILNAYGPTECSDDVTHYFIEQALPENTIRIPIGRPVINTQLYVLDEQLRPLPIGVWGELYVGGMGVGRGYIHDAVKTAQKFITDPFASVPGKRLYRTGDLARILPGGLIEFLGRIDQQVKIRGYRIELEEIQVVLAQHPAIREAVVADRDLSKENKIIVAYIVPQPGTAPSIDELLSFLKKKLPDYMIPSAIVFLDRIPLTANGKTDHKNLPTPHQVTVEAASELIAPRTDLEELIAAMMAEVLDIQQMGITNNFFETGGHSLLATQFLSRIRMVFQVELPLRAFFSSPTVEGTKEMLLQAEPVPGKFEAIARLRKKIRNMPAEEIQTRLPDFGAPATTLLIGPRNGSIPSMLSFAQERLWFLAQLQPDNPAYNIPAAIRIEGKLQTDLLHTCFNEVVKRHETLRTTFTTVDGRPMPQIAPEGALALPVERLDQLIPADRQHRLQQRMLEETRRSFDLRQGPLLRVRLFVLGEQTHVLLVVMHHIISDGWSMGVFIREMRILYHAFFNQQGSPLPDLPIQYADFAAWQRKWLQGDLLKNQLSWWQSQHIDKTTRLHLWTDRPRPAAQTFNGARERFQLPPVLVDRLQKLGRRENVTLFTVLLAGFKLLLYQYTLQEEINVGIPVANRNSQQTESLIGFFVNTLIIRSSLSGQLNFVELLQQIHTTSLAAWEHQDLPFVKLVEALKPDRNLGQTPLFQVMFILQNMPMPAMELDALTLTPLEIHNGAAKFDLFFELIENAEGISGYAEYNTDLFDAATITRMTDHYLHTLMIAVETPEKKISDFVIMTEKDQRHFLFDLNQTHQSFPRGGACLHQLIEAQAKRSPEAIAIIAGSGLPEETRLTYQALDQRTDQLAFVLRKKEAGPGKMVAILADHSIELVVSILAILKAGAAFMPLDPDYPTARKLFMYRDSKAILLITQSHLPGQQADFFEGIPNSQLIVAETIPGGPAEIVKDQSTVLPADLAYLLYTSGTSGMPKGVMVEHRNIVNYLLWAAATYVKDEKVMAPLFTSPAFDLTMTTVFLPLITGSTIIIPSQKVLKTLLQNMITDDRINLVKLTPAHLQIMDTLEIKNDPSFKTLVVGGEQLPAALAGSIHNKLKGNVAIYNEYGPTEATVGCMIHRFNPEKDNREFVPVGTPIANAQIYILYPNCTPVPYGVAGELYIGGAGVTRGYLNNQPLTAERFMPDPFVDHPEARIYKTGDLARYLPGGAIELLGRKDFQVKIRGFRIELAEIEMALKKHPGVREAVVIIREDLVNEKCLVAYVVPTTSSHLLPEEGRLFLKQHLPGYMIPLHFVVLHEMPLQVNGKVDRHSLPKPVTGPGNPGTPFVQSQTRMEKTIEAIWLSLLNLEKAGVHDNFFDLGGHSLLLVQLQAHLSEALAIDLPILTLFEYPTIHSLAKYLGNNRETTPSQPDPAQETEKIKQGKSRLQKQLLQKQSVTKKNDPNNE